MGIWEIVIGAVVLLLSVIMIIVIIFQEGHDAGLGTITGGADSFMKKGKAKTADAMFAKVTKFCAIIFFIVVVLLNALTYFGWTGASKDSGSDDTAVIEASNEDTDASTEDSTEASKDESTETSTEESTAASSEAGTEASETSAEESAASSTDEGAESSADVSEETPAE